MYAIWFHHADLYQINEASLAYNCILAIRNETEGSLDICVFRCMKSESVSLLEVTSQIADVELCNVINSKILVSLTFKILDKHQTLKVETH